LGKQTIADAAGRYQLTVPAAPFIAVGATALGYQASPLLPLASATHDLLHGPLIFNFSGPWGLREVFRSPSGDTLSPIPQILPAGTRQVSFSISTHRVMDPAFGVTDPDGDAVLLSLNSRQGGYTGLIPLDRGSGIYQVEILDGNGFPVFALSLYVGVRYIPVFPPAGTTHDAAGVPAGQLETQVLALLNGVRARFHRPPLVINPRVGVAARGHSVDVAAHPSLDMRPHLGSDGSTPQSRVRRAGVTYGLWAETVAFGSSARDALAGLLASPWHRAIMLSLQYRVVGVGIAHRADGTALLTVDYLRPVAVTLHGVPHIVMPGAPPVPVQPATDPTTSEATSQIAQPGVPVVLSVGASVTVVSGGVAVHFSQALQVLVPAGAVAQPTRVHAVLVPANRVPAVPPSAGVPNNAALGFAFDLSAASVAGGSTRGIPLHTFNPRHPLLLVSTYAAADLGSLDPATLHIVYWNAASRRWRNLPTTVDPLRHTLVAATTHFTLFQVRGTARTQAQVQRARARQAALAAAGPPQVSALPVAPARMDGVPLLVTVPAGRQRTPLLVAVTGAPHARLRVTYAAGPLATVQSLALDGQGYAVTGFAPLLASPRSVTVLVTVSRGASSATMTQSVVLLPGPIVRTPLPGAPLLRASLTPDHVLRGAHGPLLTVVTTPGAQVRALLALAASPHSTLGTASGRADRHGTLALRLPAVSRRGASCGCPRAVAVQVIVTATVSGRSTQQSLALTVVASG
jgi:hypothetical protein